MLQGPYTYRLTIQNRRYSADFGAPATIPKLAKLYTISLCRNLLYVGITHGRMSQRLGGGLRASGEHGYHGYKLNDGDFSLNIWTGGPEMGREDMESIEAEVAFEWRKRSAQWPAAQNRYPLPPDECRAPGSCSFGAEENRPGATTSLVSCSPTASSAAASAQIGRQCPADTSNVERWVAKDEYPREALRAERRILAQLEQV